MLLTRLVSNSLCNPGWPQRCSLPAPVGEYFPSRCETLGSALGHARIQKTGGIQFSFDFLLMICICSICVCEELSLNVLEAAFTELCGGDDSGRLEFQVLANSQAERLYVQSDA